MLARLRTSIKDKDEGFTLIELLVVIIIIGILAAIAIPVFLNQRKKGWDADAKAELRSAATAQETVLTETGAYTMFVTAAAGTPDLTTAGYRPSVPSVVVVTSTRSATSVTPVITAPFGAGSYCIRIQSQSLTWFYYDSNAGGLSTNVCA